MSHIRWLLNNTFMLFLVSREHFLGHHHITRYRKNIPTVSQSDIKSKLRQNRAQTIAPLDPNSYRELDFF